MEAAPEQRLYLGSEMEMDLLVVDSWVTALRVKLGMSPFLPPTFHLSIFYLTKSIVNLLGDRNPLHPELQSESSKRDRGSSLS